MAQVQADFELMVTNSTLFNGEGHHVTGIAKKLRDDGKNLILRERQSLYELEREMQAEMLPY